MHSAQLKEPYGPRDVARSERTGESDKARQAPHQARPGPNVLWAARKVERMAAIQATSAARRATAAAPRRKLSEHVRDCC